MHEAYDLAGIALYYMNWALVAIIVTAAVAAADCLLLRWPRLHLRERREQNSYMHGTMRPHRVRH